MKKYFPPLIIFSLFASVVFACSEFVVGWPTDWTISDTDFDSVASARAYCQAGGLPWGECNQGQNSNPCIHNPDYKYICWRNRYSTREQEFALYCEGPIDTDGDGIPDDQYPCPTVADCDGDGIPDGEDPCPQNPNPNCTDPENPPPELPPAPEFPEEIIIGDCVVDISDITSIFKAEGGVFPINWIVAFGSALSSFTQFGASEAPSFKYSFLFFGQSFEIDLHLERFDSIASFVRLISGLLVIFYFIRFANRGFFKVITGSGT